MDQLEHRIHRSLAFERMESMVQEMQDLQTGVPVRSQKQFLTSIPSAFTGYDVIEWLMERLKVDDPVEAVNIANQLCHYGYFFPVSDSKNLVVKDDGSLYRFQIPYFWPSHQMKNPDNIDYAIFLVKRNLRNKQRHGLEDFEVEALNNLRKNLANKWNFITMQAEEQVKLSKDRKKGDKIVSDSQEKAYWRVHRPPPGYSSSLEPLPPRGGASSCVKRQRNAHDIKKEIIFLKNCLDKTRQKVSVALENLIQYSNTYFEYDPIVTPIQPTNPWFTDDVTYWQLNSSIVEVPTEKRVKRWAISMKELITDPTGLHEFTTYLTKEYCLENIRFWMAVNDLRRSSPCSIVKKVQKIYDEYLAPNAKCQINIDSKTMEKTVQEMANASRFTFDAAAEHVYTVLLKKDCYPRFIRSEHYKNLLQHAIQPAGKKGKFDFFGFGSAVQARKNNPGCKPLPCGLQAMHSHAWSSAHSTNSTRRRGSDRSLSGSTHELAGGAKISHFSQPSNTIDFTNRDSSKKDTSADEVCPWDFDDPPNRHLQPSTSVVKDTHTTLDNAASSITSRKNSIVLDSSSSSDISTSVVVEVTERLKKTCGLHDFRRFSQRSTSTVNSKQTDSSRPSVSSTEDLTSTPFRSFDSNPAERDNGILSVTENESSHFDSPNRRRSFTSHADQKSPISNATPSISITSGSMNDGEKIKHFEHEASYSMTTTSKSEDMKEQTTNRSTPNVLENTTTIEGELPLTELDKSVISAVDKDSKTVQSTDDESERSKASTSNEICPWEDEERVEEEKTTYVKIYTALGYI